MCRQHNKTRGPRTDLCTLEKIREWKMRGGNSLEVQWLGLSAFIAVARVQSLVGELRSCKLQSGQRKEKERKKMREKIGRAHV